MKSNRLLNQNLTLFVRPFQLFRTRKHGLPRIITVLFGATVGYQHQDFLISSWLISLISECLGMA